MLQDATVVKRGTYLYDATIVCDIRIVKTDVRYGTGDAEDPPEIADDQPGKFYYIEYGSTTARDEYHAGGGGASTLTEAMRLAEQAPGIGRTITWSESDAPD